MQKNFKRLSEQHYARKDLWIRVYSMEYQEPAPIRNMMRWETVFCLINGRFSRNYNDGGIKPYIQVKKPLEYVSYEYK